MVESISPIITAPGIMYLTRVSLEQLMELGNYLHSPSVLYSTPSFLCILPGAHLPEAGSWSLRL